MNFRKVNRHVDFPLILDMAPFCSALCKVLCYMCFIAKYLENTYVWLFLGLFSTLLEPGSRRACPLQSVWDCGTQRLHASGALHCIRQSPPSSEENRTAPQEPVRSGFRFLQHFLPVLSVHESWVFCSRGIISFEIFCQWGCIIYSSSVFFPKTSLSRCIIIITVEEKKHF